MPAALHVFSRDLSTRRLQDPAAAERPAGRWSDSLVAAYRKRRGTTGISRPFLQKTR